MITAVALLWGTAGEVYGVTMAKQSADGKWAMVPLADGFDYPVGKPVITNRAD